MTTRRAIVSGGSIGGLFAAAALIRQGWQVDVFERADRELSGRGAGIVTHDVLIRALQSVGAGLSDLGVQVHDRVAYAKSGARVATLPYPQIVTSWDRIHRLLRNLIPPGRYHLGQQITGYEQNAQGVTARFADGRSQTCDLLVAADGFRSAIRAQMLPQIQPEFSGYVVWRALAHEADLPEPIRTEVFPNFAFYAPSGTQIIGYPIAGPRNDLRPGHRRYNFVWYSPVEAADLPRMLTDDAGTTYPISIPPPRIRQAVLDQMTTEAEDRLPGPFVEILKRSERPFFTPIYDHHAPIMHDGRVALAGDAACVARPHVGMGVTKAALDALSLARHADGPLEAYSADRVDAARRALDRGRQLGHWVFDPDPDNPDGTANARLSQIMQLTAVTVD